jgi:hypothetical protein
MPSAKKPIYCATAPVDLRRSFDGLVAASKEVLEHRREAGPM